MTTRTYEYSLSRYGGKWVVYELTRPIMVERMMGQFDDKSDAELFLKACRST